MEVTQRVSINGLSEPIIGQTARIYIHTSAGLKRYNLGPVPEPPKRPSQEDVVRMLADCYKDIRVFPPLVKLKWLVDPPPFNHGSDPVRQWRLAIKQFPAGGTITIHKFEEEREIGKPIMLTSDRISSISLELITNASTHLEVEHKLPENAPAAEARIDCRWLVPTQITELPEPAYQLTRDGMNIAAVGPGYVVTVDPLNQSVTQFPIVGVSRVIPDAGRFIAFSPRGLMAIVGPTIQRIRQKLPPTIKNVEGEEPSLSATTSYNNPHVQGHSRFVESITHRVADGTELPSPYTVTLPDGRVAATFDTKLMIAIPWDERLHSEGVQLQSNIDTTE
jgi:hypothetical protein